MNEEAIQDSYNIFVSQGYTKSIDEYKKLINSNPDALNDSYQAFASQGYTKSIDDYKTLMGIGVQPKVKKKEDSDSSADFQQKAMVSPSVPTSSATQPIDEEEDYFTGGFGNVLRGFDNIVPLGIGDFVDDMARSVASGYRQGDVAQAANKLLLKGHKSTPEQLQKFIDANKNAQQMKPSDEMNEYNKIYEEEGKGFWGVIKGLVNNPTVIPEVLTSSLISMATNTDALKAGGATIGAGATRGAVVGAVATPEFLGAGAIPGAISGAASAVPYAFGLASTVVESGATFAELLEGELKGQEMTKDNVKDILENPEKLQSIRNKAIARGLIIGTVDALTGKLASGVGAKILSRSAAKSATGAATKAAVVRSTAAGSAIESAGGSLGEFSARAVTGQDMDVSEIALEGLAELPGGVRSTIQARFAKPSYKVNGEKVTASDIDNLIETMTPEELHATDIVINNDYEGRMFKIQDKVVTNTIKQEVKKANPDLNEPSLNAITELEKELQTLEGNKTQTGKDKASLLRSKIKDIQENQLEEETTVETLKTETDAIQKQTADESVLRAEQPELGLQGVGEENAKPIEATAEKEIADAKQKFIETSTERKGSELSKDELDGIDSIFNEKLKALEKPEETIIAEKPEEEVEPSMPIKDAIADEVGVYYYNGEKGQVNLDGQTVVFETNDKLFDLGNVEELSENTLEEFGISKEQELNLKLNDDNSIELNGKKYNNNYSDPESAFSKDKDGNYSVTLDTENGQKRTFRGQQADQIVYETRLKNFEKNGTEQQIEEANAAADEAIRIETEVRTTSPERKGKSVRKAKQRTLKTVQEPLSKVEREQIAAEEKRVADEKAQADFEKSQIPSDNFDNLNRSENKAIGAEMVEFSFKGSDGAIHKVKTFVDDVKGYVGLTQVDGKTGTRFTQEAEDHYKKLKEQKINSEETDVETKNRLQKGIVSQIESELDLNEKNYEYRNKTNTVEYQESLRGGTVNDFIINQEIASIPRYKVENEKRYTETKAELEKKLKEAKSKLEPKVDQAKDLLDLDTKDKTSLKRVSDYLDRLDKSLDINPNELNDVTRVMAIATAKAVIKTLKALVDAGVTLQDAIRMASETYKLKEEQISEALDIVSKLNENKSEGISELELKGYNKLSKIIDSAISNGKTIDNVLNYMNRSEVYKNATDVQKELLVRDVRKRFGLREKSAPSVAKLFGKVKDITKITMTEKQGLIKQIKDTAKGAREAVKSFKLASQQLTKDIKELKESGKITSTQLANVLVKFSKVNVLNEASVSNFVDYMTKVFADADYANKIETAKSNLKTANKNIVTKLGIADGLILPLQRLFAINPTMIPDAYLGKYLSLVDMFGKRQAVLTLEEKSQTIKDVQEILDEINNEKSLVDELSDRFNNSDNKVFTDGKLDYAASLEKMLKEGDIDNDDVALMKKYKKDIAPKVEKSELTEEEIQEEKDTLVKLLNEETVNFNELPSRDERNLAKEINSLIKKSGIKELTNEELKNILKVIDNINNGYLPHYAQLVVEKLNSIENAKELESAINKAKPLPVSKLYSKAKSLITKKDSILEMIRRNPLFNIDQVFGDFKTKDIFNSILKKAAEAEAKFTSELKNIQAKLEKAEENIAKSHGLNPNKTLMSKFKMMTYMVQLEYDSNPNNKQVNPASEYLKATIKHIDDGKSQFGERDAEMLQKIYDEYTDSEGNIDNEKLYNSLNEAEKAGIKTIREINESLKEKAEYTGAIIRGQKINPLNNYVHLNVLHEHKPNDLASGTSFANDYNNSMRPTTKAKSLIERTGKVSPLNFDVFASAQRGSKFVLMDYHLTEPIRTARKTMNKAISNLESTSRIPKEKRKIASAISNALEEAISNLITNSYTTTSIGDDVIDYISKQGYRSVLAGTGRFAAEFISNVGFVLLSDPTSFVEGIKNTGVIMSSDAPAIMSNVNSKEINRIFPTDTLSGRMIDTNVLSEVSGVKGGKSKNTVLNKIQQIWNLSGKKYANAVELTADILITTPDKAIMRPIWFGSFSENFRKIAGKDIDFEKIAANDEVYMEENKDAIEEAKNIADERSVITGASSNAFTGILKGTSKPEQSNAIKAFNNFNGFMSKFLIYEFVTARTGIMAAIGNGSLTKRQGVALLGAVTTRMTVYSLLIKALGEGVVGLLFDDDDDEDKKAPKEAIGQALASSFTSMIFGRDFGNSTKTLINYGLERVNENYLDFLREGEYDPYKDALQYSVVPTEKKGSQTDLSDFLFNMGGSFGPVIKTTDLAVRKYFEPERKEAEAIERQEKEIGIRIPLEVLGNLGFVPLYKEIRKSVMKDIYKKTLEQELLGSYESKEQMKKYNSQLYERTFGEGTMYDRIKKREEKANFKLKERLKEIEKNSK